MADTDSKKDDKKSTKSDDTKGQVIDVARPGTAKPSATSRPVIVGSGKIMQDPMVVSSDNKESSDESADSSKAPAGSNGKTIQPLTDLNKDTDSDQEDSEEEKAKDTDVKPENPPADNTDDKPTEDSSPTDASNNESSEEPKSDKEKSSENAIVDAVVYQASNKKKNTTGQETETNDERYKSLIEEKKYFVTIAKHRKQRNQAVVIAISIFAIIATVVVVANEYDFISLW